MLMGVAKPGGRRPPGTKGVAEPGDGRPSGTKAPVEAVHARAVGVRRVRRRQREVVVAELPGARLVPNAQQMDLPNRMPLHSNSSLSTLSQTSSMRHQDSGSQSSSRLSVAAQPFFHGEDRGHSGPSPAPGSFRDALLGGAGVGVVQATSVTDDPSTTNINGVTNLADRRLCRRRLSIRLLRPQQILTKTGKLRVRVDVVLVTMCCHRRPSRPPLGILLLWRASVLTVYLPPTEWLSTVSPLAASSAMDFDTAYGKLPRNPSAWRASSGYVVCTVSNGQQAVRVRCDTPLDSQHRTTPCCHKPRPLSAQGQRSKMHPCWSCTWQRNVQSLSSKIMGPDG